MTKMKIISISILGFSLMTAGVTTTHASLTSRYTAGEFTIVNDSKNEVDVEIFQGSCAKEAKKTIDKSDAVSAAVITSLKKDCNSQKHATLTGKYEAPVIGMKRDSITIAPGQWAVAFKQGNNPNAFIPAVCLPDSKKKGNILRLYTPKIAGVSVGFKCTQVEEIPE